MRIGFILPANYALSGGGQGVRVQALCQAEALRKRGYEVLLMNPWEPFTGEPLDVIQYFQGGFAHFWIDKSIKHRAKLSVFAPIIDTNESNRRYRLAARLGNLTGKFFTVPGVFQDQAQSADLVVVRSSHERDRIVQGLGIDPNKVEIVLNGVTPPPSTTDKLARRTLELPDEYILHVSAHTQQRKNVVRMIEAIGPTGKPLVIAGTAVPGPILDRIKALSKQYGNITLLGFLDRDVLESLYAGCRVFCLPSINEGTGLVALEASVHGAGVVITKCGGPPDYFGEHGYLVDPYDVESIRSGLMKAWNEPGGEALCKHVVENLTWEQSAMALAKAYQKHMT
ncbi:MAG: glycosyltransferase family 4 protein [Planctomycetota bacterium]